MYSIKGDRLNSSKIKSIVSNKKIKKSNNMVKLRNP